jgi:dephospho-CoA kinase
LIFIGLTGGIGSGKSTVARLLEAKGAEIIDADILGHEVQVPGEPAYEALIRRFGPDIVGANGSVDRAKLGRIVFEDPAALVDLNAIVHPEIYKRIIARIDELKDSNRVVVLDAALLVETLTDRRSSIGLDALVVVAANPEDQTTRIIEDRGMSRQDAEARISAQAPQGIKLAAADYVVDNRGSMEDLEKSVETLWEELIQLGERKK